ncbi:hypothetical protein NFI96_009790, partial [Prochilodus magdalenae]
MILQEYFLTTVLAKILLIAVYEAMDLQQRAAASPGGSVASGYSSPEPSEPELGGLQPGSEIEVTPNTLKS